MGILTRHALCGFRAVKRLSELEIDADKDWNAKGITSVKQAAPLMAKGDMLFFDGVRLVKLTSSSIGSMLTTHDMGNDPTWSY